ncbi:MULTISPECIES: hypothetical protein [unclassified Beijerinckia]|uniref:hypothetical protein n=1 Tax=unclassified Beijerinckia TaxID=2638183 RepID=UPI00089C4C91|nr:MULTISPECIES: hypothetical protein [unclassified Beijerinckia]MDH7799612.1 hypothetical protein [Beijerinckia sp. GAS462]SEB47774.1 hypothetical protein SAMN05443249_0103 [Beijerinckia sp. 28-YEA-48]
MGIMIRAALFLVLFAVPALADAPKLAPMPKPSLAPIEAWGVRNASCLEWTDACQTCARSASGKPQCSTVGIACVRKAATCTKQAPR